MTIVVDTSAIVAILYDEGDRQRLLDVLEKDAAVISAGNLIELLRVVMRRTPHLTGNVRDLLRTMGVSVAPVDEAQVVFAEEGQSRFGLGRSAPPAVLNFGDLFAYALARQLDAPLLFKGEDFAATDVRPAA